MGRPRRLGGELDGGKDWMMVGPSVIPADVEIEQSALMRISIGLK